MIDAQEFLHSHPVAEEQSPLEKSDSTRRNTRKKRRVETITHGNFAIAVADDPHNSDECKERALRLLDAAARSRKTLHNKLVERGFSEETIEPVLDRLTELGFIDDEAFGQAVLRSCITRGMGSRGAYQELVRKGIEPSLAQMLCNSANQEGAFEDAAWQLGRQVARKTAGLDLQVRKRRFWSAGGRKGHSSDILRVVCEALFTDHEEE